MLTVNVDPGTAEVSNATQEALEELYLDMKMVAPGADIAPKMTPAITEQREPLILLTTLIVGAVKLGAFDGMFQLWKTWLAQRPRAEITIQGKNGTVLKISNASPEQAMKFFHEQDH